MQYRIPDQSPAGWFARLIGAVVGLIVMVGLFFLGLTIFAAVAGLAIVVFIVVAIRVWWLRRQLRARGGGAKQQHRRKTDPDRAMGVTLEGEYEERRERR